MTEFGKEVSTRYSDRQREKGEIMKVTIQRFGPSIEVELRDGIDIIYRADGSKGAEDGGATRKACKALCERIDYNVSGISVKLIGLDARGIAFVAACPNDCIVEVIGGHPAIYQAEVKL